MDDKNKVGINQVPPNGKAADPNEDDRGQAMQINENTINDPEIADIENGDEDLQSRSDAPERDQALQINENTVGDEE